MNDEIAALKKTARLAGLLYFASSALGFYSVIYVPQKVLVKGNVAATVENILANEFLFRIGIVANIVSALVRLLLCAAGAKQLLASRTCFGAFHLLQK